MSFDDYKTSWVVTGIITKKPWGEEMYWPSCSGGHGKILYIKKDNRTSFKYNTLKSETLTLIKGRALAFHGNENYFENNELYPLKETLMVPGTSLNIQSGCPYRIQAIEDSEIIEVGNSCSNQTVRLEDDYGRVKSSFKQENS